MFHKANYILYLAITFVTIFCLIPVVSIYSDTIKLKDGTKEKGVVVEEYSDRIVLSQEEGEAHFLKKDIEEVLYDTKEQNFLALGDFYKDKKNFDKALEYYKKALNENSSFKEAKDAIRLITTLKLREKELRKKAQVKRRMEFSSGMGFRKRYTRKMTSLDKIKEKVGILYKKVDEGIVIEQLIKNSPAEGSGLKKGDLIVSIWGSLIRYSTKSEIESLLLNPRYKEVKFLVEREIAFLSDRPTLNFEEYFGFSMLLDEEGLKVVDVVEGSIAQELNIEKGDFIHKVNNELTRYIYIDKVKELIKKALSDQGRFTFTIRREISLIRKE